MWEHACRSKAIGFFVLVSVVGQLGLMYTLVWAASVATCKVMRYEECENLDAVDDERTNWMCSMYSTSMMLGRLAAMVLTYRATAHARSGARAL